MMFHKSIAFLAISMTCAGVAMANDNLAVRIDNRTKPVLCAEEDNVTLTFQSAEVRRFRIEAAHPSYLGSIRDDNWKADWTDCAFGPTAPKPADAKPSDAKPAAKPKLPERVTLYEQVDRWLVGLKFPNFWRPAITTVRVGDKVHAGLHLLQLWRVRPNGGEEVLVLYPQDGYWRARPLAPRGRDLTAFGSSFLIGPVETIDRPVVRLSQVTYRPKTNSFRLDFAAGGAADVRIAEVNDRRLALDVAFDRNIARLPFSALRSMYVTEFNNDMARVAVRTPNQKGWREAGIMGFEGGLASDVWMGRVAPSRHNTSAPDMVFKAFRGE